jgi:hypothetical protein
VMPMARRYLLMFCEKTLEPIRKEVEVVESVMIRYGHLIWSGVPHVEAGAPQGSGSARTAL